MTRALEVSFHESGHACVAIALGIRVRRAVLADTGFSEGRVQFAGGRALVDQCPTAVLVANLAGHEAQRLFNPHCDVADASRDFHFVRELCWAAIMSANHPPEDVDREATELFGRLQALAAVHVREHRKWITRVAHALMRDKELDHAAIVRLRP